MTIEEIHEYEFIYTTWNRTFPIHRLNLYVRARTSEEAQQIVQENDYKFFDQNVSVSITKVMSGYRQVIEEKKS